MTDDGTKAARGAAVKETVARRASAAARILGAETTPSDARANANTSPSADRHNPTPRRPPPHRMQSRRRLPTAPIRNLSVVSVVSVVAGVAADAVADAAAAVCVSTQPARRQQEAPRTLRCTPLPRIWTRATGMPGRRMLRRRAGRPARARRLRNPSRRTKRLRQARLQLPRPRRLQRRQRYGMRYPSPAMRHPRRTRPTSSLQRPRHPPPVRRPSRMWSGPRRRRTGHPKGPPARRSKTDQPARGMRAGGRTAPTRSASHSPREAASIRSSTCSKPFSPP